MAIVTDIRLQDSFFDNRKILKLERRLGPKAVLNLQRLWMHTAKNNPKGVLIGFDDDDIEIAAKWEGERGEFVREILCLQLLEAIDGGFVIHDWEEAQPWAFNSDTRAERATKGGIAKAKKLLEAGDKQATSTARSTAPSLSFPSPSSPIHSEPTKRRRASKPALDGFSEFWQAYPRKEARAVAEKAWGKVLPIEHPAIMAAVNRQAASEQWTKDGGKFIPHPATWLNQRRWEDAPLAAQAEGPDPRWKGAL